MSRADDEPRRPIRSALERLSIERFVLSIHQASFPAGEDDVGWGTPYSARAFELLQAAAAMGFDGVALGPSGKTSRVNPSPYDATAFSRNPLHIALGPLTGTSDWPWATTVHPSEIEAARRAVPVSGSYADAFDAHASLLSRALDRADTRDQAELDRRLDAFRSAWLFREREFEELAAAAGTDDWTTWARPFMPRAGAAGRRFELEQLLAHEQHAAFRGRMRALGMRVYADLAIGTSHRDRYLFRDRFLRAYAMGAPPSRTNPLGQPWGYPVLDPGTLASGPARDFVRERIEKLFAEHDGVRIDHPHGWVCPWVYDADAPDAGAAVRAGARLFESPDLEDHPRLARIARVAPEQIGRGVPRYADDWVTQLSSAQVDAYAVILDLFVEVAKGAGADHRDLMVEVLSTCPRPLAAVLARHGLGRFRVTQKANPDDRADVYRTDRAAPQDWVMVGNHDTPPIALVVDRWREAGALSPRIRYLCERLVPNDADRAAFGERLASEPGALQSALLSDLFVGPAKNVLVFWADLFGERRIYNRPGEVHPENWTLRVPTDFEHARALAVARGDAPSIELALAWALAARGDTDVALRESLVTPGGAGPAGAAAGS